MVACPHCGFEDSLEVLVDAYVVYAFKGFENGAPMEHTYTAVPLRTDQFDDTRVVCAQCGEDVEEHHFLAREAAPEPVSHLVIKFGDEADRMIQPVTAALYHVTVEIEYNHGNPFKFPTEAVLLTGDDDGITICNRGEGGEPLLDKKFNPSYKEIKSITIL